MEGQRTGYIRFMVIPGSFISTTERNYDKKRGYVNRYEEREEEKTENQWKERTYRLIICIKKAKLMQDRKNKIVSTGKDRGAKGIEKQTRRLSKIKRECK